MKGCEEIRELMSVYIDEEAEPEDRARLEKHLRECEECAEIMEELTELAKKMRSVPELKTPDNFHGDAMIRLRNELDPVEIFIPGAKNNRAKDKRERPKAKGVPLWRVCSAAGLLVASMFAVSFVGSTLTERTAVNPENSVTAPMQMSLVTGTESADIEEYSGTALYMNDTAGQNISLFTADADIGSKTTPTEQFVKQYNIVLNVEDFDSVIKIMESIPGVNVNMSVDYGAYQSANITRNVPQPDYRYSKDILRGLGTVQSESESEYRISGDIVRLESQLRAKEDEISRLLALLEKSGSLSNLNAVESRIATATGERDRLKTQILNYKAQVESCVLKITINYVNPIGFSYEKTYIERLNYYFLRSLEVCKNVFENVLVFLSSAVVPLAVIAVLAMLALRLLFSRSKVFPIRGGEKKNEK